MCDSFEASFLAVQAYLMSAMITPDFVVLVNDFLLVPFPCYLHNGHVRIGVGVPGFGTRQLLQVLLVSGRNGQIPSLVMPASGCHASSRIRFTLHSICFPLIGCLVPGLWISRQRFLSFSCKCLYVVVLLHFEKVEFAFEGYPSVLC